MPSYVTILSGLRRQCAPAMIRRGSRHLMPLAMWVQYMILDAGSKVNST